jgi:hypothetical protein
MSGQAGELKRRTFQFTLDVIERAKTFPDGEPGPAIKRQLLKAATSVARTTVPRVARDRMRISRRRLASSLKRPMSVSIGSTSWLVRS